MVLRPLPTDVEHLPTKAGQTVVPVLITSFSGPPEMEAPTVGLDPEPNRREADVEDGGKPPTLVVDAVLPNEWRQVGRAQAVLDELFEPRATHVALDCGAVQEVEQDPGT